MVVGPVGLHGQRVLGVEVQEDAPVPIPLLKMVGKAVLVSRQRRLTVKTRSCST